MLKSTEFQQFQSKSYLTELHPFVKVIGLSVISLLLIIVSSRPALYVINGFVLFLLFTGRFSYKLIGSILGVLLILFYSTLFSQTLFYGDYPRSLWFKVHIYGDVYIRFWEEGISHGINSALRLSAPLMLSVIIYTTTSTHQFLTAFQSLKIPFEIRFMLTTSLRFVPIFIEDYKTVRVVQRLKGYQFSLFHPIRSLFTEIKLFQPVFFHALRNAQVVGESVLGRGYHPNIKTEYSKLSLSQKEKILLVTFISGLACVVFVKLLFILYINNMYYMSSLRFLYEFNRRFL